MSYPTRIELPSAGYPADSDGILSALAAGFRWLVFSDTIIQIKEPIQLDRFANAAQLRLDGGGPNITHLIREFDGAPLIQSTKGMWRLYWYGIHFVGDKEKYPTPAPLTEFACVQLSHFELCKWECSTHHGFVAAVDEGNKKQFDTAQFINCWADDNGIQTNGGTTSNGGRGFYIGNGCDVTFFGGGAQRNAAGGIYYRSPQKNAVGQFGMGRFHLELNGVNGNYGIELENVSQGQVAQNYAYLSNIVLKRSTVNVTVCENTLIESNIIDESGKNFCKDRWFRKYNNAKVSRGVGTADAELTGCQ